MSGSESSASVAGVRALGLQRSLDARTQEFLRLSRKRQLRRGCACAAASTAGTVALLIVVFFVYEFSLNSNTQLEKSLNYKWLSLINNTEDGTSFDPKLTKANIDRTTLRLLPLLLKAFKKNAALEKLFDEQSNSLSPDEARDKKKDHETSNEQNVHANDWLKKPTTHLFAVDHKTLPIIFYRDPTKNIELYTKIRKIRDYQRVFKYVDKMIHEKVYVRSTKPMQPDPVYLAATTPRPASNNTNKRVHYYNKAESKNTPIDDMKHTCKCAHHFKELLNKIRKQYETILPQFKQYNMKAMRSNCQNNSVKNLTLKAKSSYADLSTPLPTYSSSEISIQTVAVPPQRVSTFVSVDDNLEREVLQYKESRHVTESNNKLSINDWRYIKKLIDTQPIKPKVLDKFNRIMNKTQISKRQDIKVKTKLQPIFGGIEYDDYSDYTISTTKKTANIDYVIYMKTKLNYLRDIYAENTKKRAFNRIKSFKTAVLSNVTNINMKVNDNKTTLLKTKPKLIYNRTNETEYNDHKHDILDKNHTSSLNLFKRNNLDAEKQIISNLFNSSAVIEKYFKNNLIKTDVTVLPVEFNNNKKNQYASKSTYYKYSTSSQEDKTIYDILKDSVHSYISHKSSRMYSTPPLKIVKGHERSKTTMRPLKYDDKNSKSSTYRIIENHVNSLLHKNISSLKTLKQKYFAIIPTVQTLNNNEFETDNRDKNKGPAADTPSTTESNENTIITTAPTSDIWTRFHTTSFQSISNPLNPNMELEQKSNMKSKYSKILQEESHSSTIEPNENLTEESDLLITEITKTPINAIHQSSFNLSEKQINSDLTWEDLTNEFMPAWRSMIQDPNKPIYLGFQKSDDRIDEQDDYNINSNFYDLNL